MLMGWEELVLAVPHSEWAMRAAQRAFPVPDIVGVMMILASLLQIHQKQMF
jgi:hypothetical protein